MRTELGPQERQIYAELTFNIGDIKDGIIKRKYQRALDELMQVKKLGFSILNEMRGLNREILDIIYDQNDRFY